MEILPYNKLKVEVSEEEYESSENKEQFIVEAYGEGMKYYYKIVSDNEEKNTILNIYIYKRLSTITKIAKFFLALTILDIIATFILALK